MSFTTAALLVSWVAIVILAFGMAGLMRQVIVLTTRVGQVGSGRSGARTPRDLIGFTLPNDGPTAALRHPGGAIVLFSSPTCASCAATLDDLGRLATNRALVVVSAGSCAGVSTRAPAVRCIENGRSLLDQLAVPATPYLVAIDADGTVRDTLMPSGSHDLEAWPPLVLTQEHR